MPNSTHFMTKASSHFISNVILCDIWLCEYHYSFSGEAKLMIPPISDSHFPFRYRHFEATQVRLAVITITLHLAFLPSLRIVHPFPIQCVETLEPLFAKTHLGHG